MEWVDTLDGFRLLFLQGWSYGSGFSEENDGKYVEISCKVIILEALEVFVGFKYMYGNDFYIPDSILKSPASYLWDIQLKSSRYMLRCMRILTSIFMKMIISEALEVFVGFKYMYGNDFYIPDSILKSPASYRCDIQLKSSEYMLRCMRIPTSILHKKW